MAETSGEKKKEVWKVFVDGLATKQGGRFWVMLISPQGDEIYLVIQLNFKVSNNKAEYEILLTSVKAAKYVRATKLIIYSGSQLVVQQLKGTCEIKNDRLRKYTEAYEKLKIEFQEIMLQKVSQDENEKVDELARMTSILSSRMIKDLIIHIELVTQIDRVLENLPGKIANWREMLFSFLKQGKLLEDLE